MVGDSGIARVIVNADDFGLSPGVNRGIARAHRTGIVTSASLMVRAKAAKAAAEVSRVHPSLSVGLHLDLGEWRFADGQWAALYERAPLDDAKALEGEVSAQFAIFAELLGTAPTHVDSHQHAHRNEPLRSIVTAHAAERGIPVRHLTPDVRYCGDFYGQDETGAPYPDRITARFLGKLLRSLRGGTTELCCHPAEVVDFDSAYAIERVRETQALCDSSVWTAVEEAGLALIPFESVRRLAG
jgi:predicted glycoside hydrolase/deacetylase ChbG (UPF0249 family)